MPLYEFECEACGKRFEELFRSLTERRRPCCPKCKSPKVHKKFSTFATSSTQRGKSSGGGGGCGTCHGRSCATCR